MAKGVYSRTRRAECESRVFSVTSFIIFLFKEPMAFLVGWLRFIYFYLKVRITGREGETEAFYLMLYSPKWPQWLDLGLSEARS